MIQVRSYNRFSQDLAECYNWLHAPGIEAQYLHTSANTKACAVVARAQGARAPRCTLPRARASQDSCTIACTTRTPMAMATWLWVHATVSVCAILGAFAILDGAAFGARRVHSANMYSPRHARGTQRGAPEGPKAPNECADLWCWPAWAHTWW